MAIQASDMLSVAKIGIDQYQSSLPSHLFHTNGKEDPHEGFKARLSWSIMLLDLSLCNTKSPLMLPKESRSLSNLWTAMGMPMKREDGGLCPLSQ